jgi:predicted protein tyrosine phosphatase
MKILFVCTSNKDRSPALEKLFREKYPKHIYKSAGINKYFCSKKNTHYLTKHDIIWADYIVYAEDIHYEIAFKKILPIHFPNTLILNCGEYIKGDVSKEYLDKVVKKMEFLNL